MHRVLLDTDALLLEFGRDEVVVAAAIQCIDAVRAGRQVVATGHVNVASDAFEHHERVSLANAVRRHVGRKAPVKGRGLTGRIEASRTTDVVSIDLGNLGSPFRRLVLHLLAQRVEAVAPLLDEVMVVEVLFDNHVDHRQRDGGVGAGTRLDIVLGTRAHPGDARVDVDELRAAFLHAVDKPVPEETVGIGLDGIAAPLEDDLGELVLRIVVAARIVLTAVNDGRTAHNAYGSRATRQIARVAREEAATEVRALECGVLEQRNLPHDVAAGALKGDDRFGADFIPRSADMLLDHVVRLVPGNLLPLVLAALAHALQGVTQAGRVVDGLVDHVQAAHAQTAAAELVVRVALDVVDLAVLHVEQHAAPLVAARACPLHVAVDVEFPFLPVLFLAIEILVELHLLALSPFRWEPSPGPLPGMKYRKRELG